MNGLRQFILGRHEFILMFAHDMKNIPLQIVAISMDPASKRTHCREAGRSVRVGAVAYGDIGRSGPMPFRNSGGRPDGVSD